MFKFLLMGTISSLVVMSFYSLTHFIKGNQIFIWLTPTSKVISLALDYLIRPEPKVIVFLMEKELGVVLWGLSEHGKFS